jgi:hypothetical protein
VRKSQAPIFVIVAAFIAFVFFFFSPQQIGGKTGARLEKSNTLEFRSCFLAEEENGNEEFSLKKISCIRLPGSTGTNSLLFLKHKEHTFQYPPSQKRQKKFLLHQQLLI